MKRAKTKGATKYELPPEIIASLYVEWHGSPMLSTDVALASPNLFALMALLDAHGYLCSIVLSQSAVPTLRL
jgi:hypothetical protein